MKILLISVLFGLTAVGRSLAQTTSPPAGDHSTNLLAVKIFTPRGGKEYHAPATIHFTVFITQHAPARAGDAVEVEFFANASRLGSKKSVWHGEQHPHSLPGQVMPLPALPAGYAPASLVWSNAPAGSYTLAARVTGSKGLTAVSVPVNITVMP